MSNLKNDQKLFVLNEEHPFLLLFVHKHIDSIRKINANAEELHSMLVARQLSYCGYRPDLDSSLYTSLDIEVLRCLLKKRKREEKHASTVDAPATASNAITITAPAHASIAATDAPTSCVGDSTIDSSSTVCARVVRVSQSESSRSSESNFFIDNCNVSEDLKNIRKNALASNEEKKKMNAVQILSMNHIYYLSSRRTKSVTKYTSSMVHKAMVSYFKAKLPEIPVSIKNLSRRLDEISVDFDTNSSICCEMIEDEVLKTVVDEKAKKQSEGLLYALIFLNIVSQIGQWSKVDLGETSFIDAKFNPLALGVFGKLDPNMYNYTRQDKSLQKMSQKPDFCLSISTSSGECLELYQMEAKTPEANKGNLDFLKLGNNMKLMVDNLVSRGCPTEDAKSFGTLLHGDSAFYYEMCLSHDGIYVLNEMGSVRLPQEASGFGLISQNIQLLLYIKEYVQSKALVFEALGPRTSQHPYQRRSSWEVEE